MLECTNGLFRNTFPKNNIAFRKITFLFSVFYFQLCFRTHNLLQWRSQFTEHGKIPVSTSFSKAKFFVSLDQLLMSSIVNMYKFGIFFLISLNIYIATFFKSFRLDIVYNSFRIILDGHCENTPNSCEHGQVLLESNMIYVQTSY